MQQVIGVQALSANLLLALQAKQNVVCRMERAFVLANHHFNLFGRFLSLLGFFEFTYRILNLNVFRQPQIDVI